VYNSTITMTDTTSITTRGSYAYGAIAFDNSAITMGGNARITTRGSYAY